MKSVVIERRRARRIAAGVVCASMVLGFVACSGTAEHRTTPDGGAGEYDGSDAGAPSAGKNGGGASSQGGENAAGATVAGSGGSLAGSGAGGDVGEGGTAGVGEGGTGGVGEGGTAGVGEGGTAGVGEGGTAGVGEGGTAGVGEGGTAGVGNGGEGGTGDVIDPVCGLNMAQVGAYSLWCGKVNMHLTAQGTWTHDTDCSSGCNVTGVGYCQKFYANATKVVAVDQTASVVKDWKNAGCADSTPDGKGISGEAVCCAPLP